MKSIKPGPRTNQYDIQDLKEVPVSLTGILIVITNTSRASYYTTIISTQVTLEVLTQHIKNLLVISYVT